MESRKQKLYFVTFLTFVRVPLVFLFFGGAILFMKYKDAWLFYMSFIAMMFSALTDLFDGYYARKFNVETKLGAYADPLTDKVFYTVSLPTVVLVAMRNGHIYHAIFLLVFAVLFLFRDQWVSFLRSIGAEYSADVKANWSGKLRTGIAFPVVCGVYAFEECPTPFVNNYFLYSWEAIAFIMNLISIVVYTRNYMPYLVKSISLDTAGKKEKK